MNANLLLMVRVAEALLHPMSNAKLHALKWREGRHIVHAWPLELANTAYPRKFMLHGNGWRIMALTSLSWLRQ
jgi:hypothetical protein